MLKTEVVYQLNIFCEAHETCETLCEEHFYIIANWHNDSNRQNNDINNIIVSYRHMTMPDIFLFHSMLD